MSAEDDNVMLHITKADDGTQWGPYPAKMVYRMLVEGQLSPEDLAWCKGQGDWRELRVVLDLDIPPALPVGWQRPKGAHEEAERVNEPYGVHGWLKFFSFYFLAGPVLWVLGLFFQIRLINLANSYSKIHPGTSQANWGVLYVWGNFIVSLVSAIFWFAVGLKLVRRDRNALVWLRWALICSVVVMTLCLFVPAFYPPPFPPWSLLQNEPGAIIGASIGGFVSVLGLYGVLWLYFKTSRRVANTFGPWNEAAYLESSQQNANDGVVARKVHKRIQSTKSDWLKAIGIGYAFLVICLGIGLFLQKCHT